MRLPAPFALRSLRRTRLAEREPRRQPRNVLRNDSAFWMGADRGVSPRGSRAESRCSVAAL